MVSSQSTGQLSTHRVTLDAPLPEIQAAELARQVFFVSETITDFALVQSSDGITALDLTVQDGADLAALTRKLRSVATNDVQAQQPFEPKIVWRRDAKGTPRNVYGELAERGIAASAGDGLAVIGEPVLSLLEYLDARIRALAASEFGAVEYQYPTLMPVAVLSRCGYLRSFPQLMMFVSRLHSDIDVYRRFTADLDDGQDLTGLLHADAAAIEHCLPPTQCFHTYAQLADRALTAPTTVITTKGRTFRFESRYQRSLERLWDFTLREIVFLGPRDFVADCRTRMMELTYALTADLGLGGTCEVAHDPFFAGADTAEQVWSQQLLELKYELRMPLDSVRTVAVGSFNFHDQFFGKAFNIASPEAGDTAYTGCVGYGLERFAFAFLCQHGIDPAGWPQAVREAVNLG